MTPEKREQVEGVMAEEADVTTVGTTSVNTAIGSRIRERRGAMGYLQREMARDSGLSVGFLSDLENGKRGVSAENLLTLAHVLGVTPDWFFRPLLRDTRGDERMGMNYYYHPSGGRTCPHCGQETPKLHVGKSSGGWCFSLRVHPDEGINSLDDWQRLWSEGGAVFDEDGGRVESAEMIRVILDRKAPGGLRSHVGLRPEWGHNAKYGGPTYDLCNYEFC